MTILIIKKKKPAPKPQPPRTLAEVVDRLKADTSLADNRRRDLISACNSVARLHGRPLESIPTDVSLVRDVLASIHPMQGHISKKRLSNIKADLAAALELTGVLPADDPDVEPSDQWVAFMAFAKEPYQRWTLARFSRFCTLRKIEPEDVDDGVLRAFTEYLDARVVAHDPKTTVKAVAKAFNVIVKQNALPLDRLTISSGTSYATAPISTYPPSLQADLATYRKRLEKPGLFSDEGPEQPLRPTSVRNIEAHIRQTLHAAVEAGFPPERFQTLADLLDFQVLDRALTAMKDRFGGRTPTSFPNILGTLIAIAKHHVGAPTEVVVKLQKARKKAADELGSNHPKMSEKVERRLDQFEIERNVRLLVDLPFKLIKRANQAPGTQASTTDAMCAAAIATSLCCPMRARNLTFLELGTDIQRVLDGKKANFLIHVAADKVKNSEAINAAIDTPFAPIVDAYLHKHRKYVVDEPGPWLFPSVSGASRAPSHFATMIKEKIRKETGLVVHAHLFRHLAAKFYLEAHPHDFETVRRLLGHRKLETTIRIYMKINVRSIFRRYAEIIGDHKGEDL